MRSRFLLRVVLLLSVAAPRVAHAGPESDASAAEVLYQNAKAAMNRGDLASACAQFAESQRLDPAVGTLLNLGECEDRAGKVATALSHLREARAGLAQGDYRIPFAEARIAGLTRRVPHLTMKLRAPALAGLRVVRDGVEVPGASLAVAQELDPGVHVCVVRTPGRVDARFEVTLTEGEPQTVELGPGPPVADAT